MVVLVDTCLEFSGHLPPLAVDLWASDLVRSGQGRGRWRWRAAWWRSARPDVIYLEKSHHAIDQPPTKPGNRQLKLVVTKQVKAQLAPRQLASIALAFDDRGMSRDARPIPAPPRGWPRVEPRESRIWIRIADRWLPGHIQRWYRLPDGRWGAWLSYQADPEHPTVSPIWGHYAYDPEAIIDRGRNPEPPGPRPFSPPGSLARQV